MKKSKLKYEHVAAYLPFAVKFQKEFVKGYLDVHEMHACHVENVLQGYESAILILVPLSDLLKPKYPDGTENQNIRFWEFMTRNGKIEGLAYEETVQLIEQHFDVFGLIPAGLALDINTIKL